MRSHSSLLLISALATLACARPATLVSPDDAPHLTAPRHLVRVSNHNWDNMELFAMRGGMRLSLGVLPAAEQTTLFVSDDMTDIDGRLRLAARFEGRQELMTMNPVRVLDGQFVDWSIENDAERSSVALFPLR
jgi:hypothetical protein